MSGETLDVIHKTIYQFFDICGDDEEVLLSDKDMLLLEVNKAICNNIKALEQESKTGHWMHDGSHWKNRFICSECGYKLFDEPTNYCPNCGVKMKEV